MAKTAKMTKDAAIPMGLAIENGLVLGYIPIEVIGMLAQVFRFGAEKHQGADSWKQHKDKHYWLGKINRHALKCQSGVRYDVGEGGSGLMHSAHIMCNAACLAYVQLHELDGDDSSAQSDELNAH